MRCDIEVYLLRLRVRVLIELAPGDAGTAHCVLRLMSRCCSVARRSVAWAIAGRAGRDCKARFGNGAPELLRGGARQPDRSERDCLGSEAIRSASSRCQADPSLPRLARWRHVRWLVGAVVCCRPGHSVDQLNSKVGAPLFQQSRPRRPAFQGLSKRTSDNGSLQRHR